MHPSQTFWFNLFLFPAYVIHKLDNPELKTFESFNQYIHCGHFKFLLNPLFHRLFEYSN